MRAEGIGGRRMARSGRVLIAALLGTLAALAAVPSTMAEPPPGSVPASGHRAAVLTEARSTTSAQVTEGLRFVHHARFDVDPAATTVRARHELTLTNTAPDQRVAGGIRYTYFPEVRIPVAAGATGLAATADGGRPLPSRLDPSESPFVEVAIVDLVPDLRYGRTQVVTVTYELPAIAPRSTSPVRVNGAYVGFPLLMIGDPGETSVEVRVPPPFAVEVVGDPLDEAEDAGVAVLTATLEDPDVWFASIVARNDDALLSTEIDLGEHDVVVRAWPDDPGWAEFAVEVVTDGVPALESLIGLPWPARRTIEVLETAAPYLYGYAGWYQPVEGLIEVGDDLDGHVMLHELSHLWFNDSLFVDRWVNEGMAEVFASAAGAELGHPARTPEPIDPGAPGALALEHWSNPDLTQEVSAEQEAFGYNAAWAVMAAIEDEIGLGELAEVVGAAQRRETAYPGPGADGLRSTLDWTNLLDLLETQAGSEVAADLFARHVAGDGRQEQLTARADSRARYAALVERGDGWATPLGVRQAMISWRFADADALMEQAGGIFDRRDEMAPVLERAGAELDALRDAFEQSRSLGPVADEADEALEATVELGAALDAADRSVGPLGRVGLLFTPPQDRVDASAEALAAGDYAAAIDEAEAAVALVDGATRAGAVRLAGAGALVAVVALMVLAWRRRPSGSGPDTTDHEAWPLPPELRDPAR